MVEKKYFLEDETIVGRSFPWKSGAMKNKTIGRQHAVIRVQGDKCYLIDQSQNGVFDIARGQKERLPKDEPVLLHDGQKLLFGKGEYFIFNCYALEKGVLE